MNVESILKEKGRDVATIAPEVNIGQAISLLRRLRIGALVVSGDGKNAVGILSERDIIHALAEHGTKLLDLSVSNLMTREVVTCTPENSIAELMMQMTERRIRHIPVIDKGRLAGIVSIGDVVKSRLGEVEGEANSLRQFITGSN